MMTRREIKYAYEEAMRRAGVPGHSQELWAAEANRLFLRYCSLPMIVEHPLQYRQNRH